MIGSPDRTAVDPLPTKADEITAAGPEQAMQSDIAVQGSNEGLHEAQQLEGMDVCLEQLQLDQGGVPHATAQEGEVFMNGAVAQDDELIEDEDAFDQDEDIDEEWSEEDDRPTQYDLREYGVYQSLPIPSGPPDMDRDCDTAEEYLRRVR